MLKSQLAYLQMLNNHGKHDNHNKFIKECNECYCQRKETEFNSLNINNIVNPDLQISLIDLKHVIKIHKECRDDLEERNKRWNVIMPAILNPYNEVKELSESEEESIHEEWIENKCEEYNKYHY